jgi:hypothetical protein
MLACQGNRNRRPQATLGVGRRLQVRGASLVDNAAFGAICGGGAPAQGTILTPGTMAGQGAAHGRPSEIHFSHLVKPGPD